MKKIMFNDRYGLTEAVLEKRKTMTRRMIPIGLYNQTDWKAVSEGNYEAVSDGEGDWHDIRLCGQYQIGEEVAVAQSYSSIKREIEKEGLPLNIKDELRKHKGWTNKMFVRADLMPHRIRITNIRVERLQNISDEDCAREGIVPVVFRQWHKQEWNDFSPQQYTDHHVWTLEKFRDGIEDPWEDSEPDEYMAETAQVAFAVLINKMSGKGTWQRNPWVFVYEFELVK